MPTKIKLYHETSKDTYDNVIEIFAFCAITLHYIFLSFVAVSVTVVDFVTVFSLK